MLLASATATAQPAPDAAPAAAPPMTERLLPFDDERAQLTMAYLQAHRLPDRAAAMTGDPAEDTRMQPRVVVLHWTAGPTLESAWQTFAPARLAGRAELVGAGALNVGAHFLVDRDGSIVRIADDDRVMRHVIGLNHLAIGIENVGGGPGLPLTDAQVDANAALVRWLASRHDLTHLIGHHEYRQLEGHPWFEERDPGYRTAKSDPGAAFMDAVRARVVDLGLAGPASEAPPAVDPAGPAGAR